jgi:hypothetical protein
MEGRTKMILAIDPGNIESAYVVINDDLSIKKFGKIPNEEMISIINATCFYGKVKVVIEMIASYGMAVGKEVFETCVWIGRFTEMAEQEGRIAHYIYRKEEKMNLCGTMKAKDSNIIQALKDRFGDKGTKNNPGWFYGFSKDVWQAYAVGVTYHDLYLKDK